MRRRRIQVQIRSISAEIEIEGGSEKEGEDWGGQLV
jgi:hypothetical protein